MNIVDTVSVVGVVDMVGIVGIGRDISRAETAGDEDEMGFRLGMRLSCQCNISVRSMPFV